MARRNYCANCPMHWHEVDYWEEHDEGCMCNCDGWFNDKYEVICYVPVFIKKLYLKYLNWREERYWRKHIKDYEERENECGATVKRNQGSY